MQELEEQLDKVNKRVKELWHLNCAQLVEFDAVLTAKENEICALKGESAPVHSPKNDRCLLADLPWPLMKPSGQPPTPSQRRGKAPPVDSFTGENPEVRFEDWLPSLE